MPGFLAHTESAPALRCWSTWVPGTPVTMTTLPLWPGRLSTRYWASVLPNWNWSVLTLSAQGAVTTLSYETTRMFWAQACAMTPLRPVGEAALMTMASGFEEMMSSICLDCEEMSLLALNQLHFTSVLYGAIWHVARNS